MNDDSLPQPSYGRHRVCPHCGARVAQRASECFACGSSLDDGPRRRRSIPWADIVLFAVIGGLLVLWWTHPPATASSKVQLVPTPSAVPSPDLAWLAGDVTAPGETAIVPPTFTPTPPPPPPTVLATPQQHKVKSGESVGLIADNYGVKVKDLVAINNLSSNGFIVPGQMLTIPGTSMPVPPTITPTPTGGTLIYTIKSGDTFYGLAVDFHTDVDLILQANKKKITDFLGVGDHLLIPLGGDTPQPTPTSTGTPVPPTFTPQAGFHSPSLLMPSDGSTQVGKDEILLTWTAVGLLANDEWYVVVVRSEDSGKPVAVHWTKGTNWRLTSTDRAEDASPSRYSWVVQVVRGMPDRQDTRPTPLSPPGEPRLFTW